MPSVLLSTGQLITDVFLRPSELETFHMPTNSNFGRGNLHGGKVERKSEETFAVKICTIDENSFPVYQCDKTSAVLVQYLELQKPQNTHCIFYHSSTLTLCLYFILRGIKTFCNEFLNTFIWCKK